MIQLDSKVEEIFEDCMQFLQRFVYSCEHEVKFVSGENREDDAFFTITNNYRIYYDPSDEQNELYDEIHEYERRESDLNWNKIFRYREIGASCYCIVPKLYCFPKCFVNIQSTEDIYCFVWRILAHSRKVHTYREPATPIIRTFLRNLIY